MSTITVDVLLATARKHEGQTLTTTARGARFRVTAHRDSLEVAPESSGPGNTKKVPLSELRRFCDEFNKSGSRLTSHYAGLTHNASYLLRLVELS